MYAHDYGKYFWRTPGILAWLEANQVIGLGLGLG